jgi:hypothetical protein
MQEVTSFEKLSSLQNIGKSLKIKTIATKDEMQLDVE